MQHALLIAEKPSLRREIEQVYKKLSLPVDITFTEQRGHLVTLMLPSEIDTAMAKWSWDHLPFHPEQHGGWKYKVIEEKKTGNFKTAKERFNDIKKELHSGKYDFVINAGDPDQEGELLIRSVLKEAGNTLPVKRFWTNDLTEKAIEKALNNLLDDDYDPMLVNLHMAALARQHSDYRYGMNLSEAASLKMGGRVALGRVKTPILALICKREEEIENFTPVTKYGVSVIYSKAENFKGTYFIPDEKKHEDGADEDEKAGIVWFDTEKEAGALAAQVKNELTVTSLETKKEVNYAPKLYTLASLQTAAGRSGYKADRVLEILQSLYDKKYMSYPRTDCEYLASGEDFKGILSALGKVPDFAPFVNQIKPTDFAHAIKSDKWINDKKLESSGHSALRPTTEVPDLSKLSADERFIYTTVVRRFIAIFLPPMISEKTVMVAGDGEHNFRSTGRVILDKGYSSIFALKVSDDEMPKVIKGEVLGVKEKKIETRTSSCPKRYSDGELVAACENPLKYLEDESLKKLGKELSIGTPATRAGIISTLIEKDKYMARVKDGKIERIRPTETGRAIINNLRGMAICRVDLTGQWEEKLKSIRQGDLILRALEDEMMKDVEAQIEAIKNLGIKQPLGATDLGEIVCPCPVCGKNIVTGKTAFFCEGYKEGTCKTGIFKTMLGASFTKKDADILFAGGEVTKSLKSNAGKVWQQKLRYDTTQGKLVFYNGEERETPFDCPNCHEKLRENDESYYCGCGLKIWKKYPGKGTRKISHDELKMLLAGQRIKINGLISNKGGNFSAWFTLEGGKLNMSYK